MAIHQLTYGETRWINIVAPTEADLQRLREWYPYLSPLNLEDITSVIERPKVDSEDHYIFTILQLPRWDEQQRLTRPHEIDIVVAHGVVVTVQDSNLKPLERLFADAEADEGKRAALLGKSAAHTFYIIIDSLVDYLFPLLNKIDHNIRIIEERLFSRDALPLIREIGLVRRDIIAVQRIIRQLVPVVETFNNSTQRVFKDELTDYFDDVVDHIHQARDIIIEDNEVMTSLADTADKILSHRLNNIIRILTVFSVLLLPLNFIAGVYGMNLAVLPLADHPQSFFILTAIMIMVVLAMLAYFRFRRWI
jgi:magnesium transporter